MNVEFQSRTLQSQENQLREQLASGELGAGQAAEVRSALEVIDRAQDTVDRLDGLPTGERLARGVLDRASNAAAQVLALLGDSERFDNERVADAGKPDVTDGAGLQRYLESQPEGFQTYWSELSSEDRQMAMFSLQQHTAMQAQLNTMMTNMQQAQHNAAMAIARNLSA